MKFIGKLGTSLSSPFRGFDTGKKKSGISLKLQVFEEPRHEHVACLGQVEETNHHIDKHVQSQITTRNIKAYNSDVLRLWKYQVMKMMMMVMKRITKS